MLVFMHETLTVIALCDISTTGQKFNKVKKKKPIILTPSYFTEMQDVPFDWESLLSKYK